MKSEWSLKLSHFIKMEAWITVPDFSWDCSLKTTDENLTVPHEEKSVDRQSCDDSFSVPNVILIHWIICCQVLMHFWWTVRSYWPSGERILCTGGAPAFFSIPADCLVSFLFSEDAFFSCLPQANEKAVDGGLLPDANGKDPNPGGQTEGSKWQKPRLTRKSLMKCCLVKWIIASTTQQGPGTGTQRDAPAGQHPVTTIQHREYLHDCVWQQGKQSKAAGRYSGRAGLQSPALQNTWILNHLPHLQSIYSRPSFPRFQRLQHRALSSPNATSFRRVISQRMGRCRFRLHLWFSFLELSLIQCTSSSSVSARSPSLLSLSLSLSVTHTHTHRAALF